MHPVQKPSTGGLGLLKVISEQKTENLRKMKSKFMLITHWQNIVL